MSHQSDYRAGLDDDSDQSWLQDGAGAGDADTGAAGDLSELLTERARRYVVSAHRSVESAEHSSHCAGIAADTAKIRAETAAICADHASAAGDHASSMAHYAARSAGQARQHTYAACLFAAGVLLGFLLAVLAYQGVVSVVRDVTPSVLPAHLRRIPPDTPRWTAPDPGRDRPDAEGGRSATTDRW